MINIPFPEKFTEENYHQMARELNTAFKQIEAKNRVLDEVARQLGINPNVGAGQRGSVGEPGTPGTPEGVLTPEERGEIERAILSEIRNTRRGQILRNVEVPGARDLDSGVIVPGTRSVNHLIGGLPDVTLLTEGNRTGFSVTSIDVSAITDRSITLSNSGVQIAVTLIFYPREE